jgi:hypothetical protein
LHRKRPKLSSEKVVDSDGSRAAMASLRAA